MTNEQQLFIDGVNAESAVLYDKIWNIIEKQTVSMMAITASLDALAKIATRVVLSVDSRVQEDTLSDFIELVNIEFTRRVGKK